MKVSVIIAVYNGEKYIVKAIKSVLNQSYKDIEIIVVDDGSTDNTKQILYFLLKIFSRYNIKYIYQNNYGSISARDKGIRNSSGKYIAILDSDDVWCDRDKLKKQVEFLENNPNYALVGGNMIKVNEKGRVIGWYNYPENDKDIRNLILFNNTFAHSTVVFRKDAWEIVNGYCSEFGNDWNMWLKLGRVGKFYNFQEYFVHYLEWSQNLSRQNVRKNLRLDIKMRKRYRDNYPNFRKAFVLAWISYFYSYFPFKKQLYPITLKIKKRINENITH